MHQGSSSVMHYLNRRFWVFCIISAPTATPAWLWKSQAASLITMCYACTSTKAINIRLDFSPSYRHLSFSNSQWKTGHFPLLYYIIPSLPHPVSVDHFRIRYRGKMEFLIFVHIHDLHFNKTYTYPTPNLSYTNTSKLTWNKLTIQSVFNSYLIPLFEAKRKQKNSHLFGSQNHLLQINSYLFA